MPVDDQTYSVFYVKKSDASTLPRYDCRFLLFVHKYFSSVFLDRDEKILFQFIPNIFFNFLISNYFRLIEEMKGDVWVGILRLSLHGKKTEFDMNFVDRFF